MIDGLFDELNDKMEKTLAILNRDFSRVRTGRASVTLLDGIRVDAYGTQMPLNQVASLSVPESRLIVIQPWDNGLISHIERLLLKSDLGLTPMNDGKIIRVSIPALTEARRKELVKVVKKLTEENKVAIRNARRDANEMLKELKKDKEIAEDELFKQQERVQKLTDGYISQADKLCADKEKEIMEF
ncbi:MAG: ribosome recycling factor [Deltaproteobacteria bacterium]|nr:ribosome recycling factor [Deltaproteobacteria bacterium]